MKRVQALIEGLQGDLGDVSSFREMSQEVIRFFEDIKNSLEDPEERIEAESAFFELLKGVKSSMENFCQEFSLDREELIKSLEAGGGLPPAHQKVLEEARREFEGVRSALFDLYIEPKETFQTTEETDKSHKKSGTNARKHGRWLRS